jgi:hypothetical protein
LWQFFFTELRADRIRQIIEKFGKFQIARQVPESIIQLLNLVPNLETVKIAWIKNFLSESFIKGKLELNKLMRIRCHSVSAPVIGIFEQLPPNRKYHG